ncbi:MAG: chromosome segregation protein SMC [Planctomycetota bacterium]|nr:chromosome segregation protein SMC [Planctomycetota bacterium]
MRLKKLILHGFKSFADRTEFSFDSPITGIVGPNGCGKSNVVDGFKWVLGEQSAKSLRGDAMMDVIFNGSSARKPSGMAEVALVFENPPKPDGTRAFAISSDEVTVGRRLFRDGTSEYQINNQVARLKDVRELFLDTGIGVDAYSVIEQGRVSALLEANPEERRLIFEEAAGISKFKARKKESQRKLEKVDLNLLRVNDIVEEVDKRLRSVKIQATKARTYQEHSTRLAELRLGYSLQEYHKHSESQNELESGRDDARFRLDDATGDLGTAQNALAVQKDNLESLSQTRQRLEYELVQSRAQIQSARQRQQYAQQQLGQMAEQMATFEQDKAEMSAKLVEVAQSLEAETKNLAALTDELNAHRELITQRQKQFSDGQLALSSAAAQIEKQKAAILDLMRKLSSNASRLGAIEIERKNIAAQESRLGDRRGVVNQELTSLETSRTDLSTRLEQAIANITEHQSHLEAKRSEAAALGKQIAQVGERLGAAKEHRSGLISRQNLLKDLEAKREGVSEGVKSVLRQRETKFPFIRGLVADVLRVDVEHAHVIEAALDGRDQYLVTNQSTDAMNAREVLEDLEGRVNIVCADRLMPAEDAYDFNQHSHRVRLAIDLVRFEPADAAIAGQLLGRTVVVDDLAVAADLQAKGPRGYRYVTPLGEILEDGGILRAGPLTAAMGLLSRRSELEALVQQISEVDARIVQLGKELADGNSAARSLEESIGSLRNSIYQANTVKVELSSAVAQNNDRQNSLRRELPILDREIQTLGIQAGRLSTEEAGLIVQRTDFESLQEQATQEVVQLTEQQKTTAAELQQLGEQLTASRVQLGQVQEKQLASQQTVGRQTAARAELNQQIERLDRSATSLASRRQDVQKEIDAAAHAEAALGQSVQNNESRSSELAGQISQISKTIAELTSKVDACREQREAIEQELHDLEVRFGEVRVRIESLVQRTQEELQLDLPARYVELCAEKPYEPAAMDWDAVAEEIKELRDKIHRLGNVNVEAIGEQDELEKRQQFLSVQVTDLTTSKAQLEQLIHEINTESSARFEQTFNAVREHFQEMFRKLFGGGKADIYLETELDPPRNAVAQIGPDGEPMPLAKIKVDILDAGIEIIARPPGKQPVSISQLSGGEKTMTCVALLMSIFKSKPSPFCILDEVDAALDEANNQRFNLIVQEFLDQSQFIIITHSKRTMQIAETLYGVTQQEQGVSKRVAVKFDQVDSQGRIAEQAAA